MVCAAGELPTYGVVVEVLDGDTVVLDSGEKVRYLGVDTPEIAHDGNVADCFGEEAREANRRLVFRKKVALKYGDEGKDHYGRLLALVLLADGKCVNEELIGQGCGFVFRTSEGLPRLAEFMERQRQAIRSGLGMWSACREKPESRYVGNRSSYAFHRPSCAMGKRMGKQNQIWFSARLKAFDEGYHPCRRCKP